MEIKQNLKPGDGIPKIAALSRRSFVRLIGAASACAGITVVGASFPPVKKPAVSSAGEPRTPGSQSGADENDIEWADPGWM